jgi:hypothetical protein
MAGIATTTGADMDRALIITITVGMAIMAITVVQAIMVGPVGPVVLAIMAAVTADRES